MGSDEVEMVDGFEEAGERKFPVWAWWIVAVLAGVLIGLGAIGLTILGLAR